MPRERAQTPAEVRRVACRPTHDRCEAEATRRRIRVHAGHAPRPARPSSTSRRSDGGTSGSARNASAASRPAWLMSHDGYSPMTTVCATSLDRRSQTPEMAPKYLSRNGFSSSSWPGRTKPTMIDRAVTLASVSSSMTSCHVRLLDRQLRARRRGLRGVPPARGSRITFGLSVDERCLRAVRVDDARGGQRGDDAPAQVGVDHQTGHVHRCGFVVQQRRQHGDVVRRQHRRAQRVDERQLMVRARRRLARQVQQLHLRTPASRSRPPSRDRRRSRARSAPATADAAPHPLRIRRAHR